MITNIKQLEHPYCKQCYQSYMDKYGKFEIRCNGIIPIDKLLPANSKLLMSEQEYRTATGIFDTVSWIKDTCGWEPRVSKDGIEYQALMLQCTALRKVFRLARRTGKSSCISVKILHFMSTHKHGKVLAVAPYKSQIDIIFQMIKEHVSKSDDLKRSIKRDVSTPYRELEFWNGSYVRGFTSGSRSGAEAGSIRGQAADILLLDEQDYLQDADINSVIAILNDHPNTQLWASSTPTGRRDKFYEFCHSPRYKEFHYTAHVLPHWNQRMEEEARENLTESGYIMEVLAEFGAEQEGVFQKNYIDQAVVDYQYHTQQPSPGYVYGLGVDWNSEKIGTEIVVVGWDGKKFRPVEAVNISRVGWTQLTAIEEIVKLNRKWQPQFINVDAGFGNTSVEVLRQYGYENIGKDPLTAALKDIVNEINFSSNIEILDPITKEPIKKHMKPFLVENAVRYFEQGVVEVSKHDTVLFKQLESYIVSRRSSSGIPVYSAREERVGDHRLDAFMLALLGFAQNYSPLMRSSYTSAILFTKRPGDGLRDHERLQELNPSVVISDAREHDLNSIRHLKTSRRPLDRTVTSSLTFSPNIDSTLNDTPKPWKWPGFFRDEPLPQRKNSFRNRPSRQNI